MSDVHGRVYPRAVSGGVTFLAPVADMLVDDAGGTDAFSVLVLGYLVYLPRLEPGRFPARADNLIFIRGTAHGLGYGVVTRCEIAEGAAFDDRVRALHDYAFTVRPLDPGETASWADRP